VVYNYYYWADSAQYASMLPRGTTWYMPLVLYILVIWIFLVMWISIFVSALLSALVKLLGPTYIHISDVMQEMAA
jgi:hypothetical protein